MSYAQPGDDSDVYVYAGANQAGNEYTCCWCQISADGHFECQSAEQMLSHLQEHKAAGHKVPDYCTQRLEGDWRKSMSEITFHNRPNIQVFLDFTEAPLFGPEEGERITSTSHLGAIEEMLDASGLPETGDVQTWLLTESQFWTIAAYKPDTVGHAEMGTWAGVATETLRESFGEEYGDEDGDDRLSTEDGAELDRRAVELVNWYVERCKVWRCEHVRTFTFDGEDVLEMIRQLRPEWLNKDKKPVV